MFSQENLTKSVGRYWYGRNNFLHGGKDKTVAASVEDIKSYIARYNEVTQSVHVVRNLNSAVWSSPSPGFVKVNFDGALQLLDHIEGVGIVIRNHEAKVLGAKSLRVHVASDSFVIKAIAAMFALEFAVDLGFTDIILEGDALSIVKGINDVGEDLSPIGVILQEAKQRKTSFRQCQVVHVARSANNVAHMLAKFGLTCDVERIWIEESPECIQSVIQTRLPISS